MVDVDNLSIVDFNASHCVGLFSSEHPVFVNEIEFRTKVTIPWCA